MCNVVLPPVEAKLYMSTFNLNVFLVSVDFCLHPPPSLQAPMFRSLCK